ncbi:MAG: hypothetical protein RMK94_13680 [Armatimonadota bacterium]|nr:hypothetical protein [Armatimonadota bacterium]
MRWIGSVSLGLFMVIGIWWWQWQSPYRTLITFLRALHKGDVDTIYALCPVHEMKTGLTKDLVERTYRQFLKPVLLDKRELVRIQRISFHGPIPEIFIRQRIVPFLLWFKDKGTGEMKPFYISVVHHPEEKKWKIAFGHFILRTAWIVTNNDNFKTFTLLSYLGYKIIWGDLGNFLIVSSKP